MVCYMKTFVISDESTFFINEKVNNKNIHPLPAKPPILTYAFVNRKYLCGRKYARISCRSDLLQ